MYDAAALAVNIPLNLLLIPQLGYLGPAWAGVATSALAAICAMAAASRVGAYFHNAPLVGVGLSVAGFAAALGLALAAGVPSLLALPSAMLAYGIILVMSRVVDRDEVRGLFARRSSLAGPVPEVL
jgi:O-antigen/teichoic acid export membrane protein